MGWYALVALLLGCEAAPQNVVVMRIDDEVRAAATELHVRVCTQEGSVAENRAIAVEDVPEPTRLPISPRGGDDSREIALEAVVRDATGRTLQAQRLFAGFPSAGKREIELAFDAACNDSEIVCADNETCAGGTCVPAAIDGLVLSAVDARARLGCCDAEGPEICDGEDQDCDGRIDEADGQPSVCVAMGLTRVRETCEDGSAPWNGTGGDRSRLNRVVLNRPGLELVGGYMYLDGDVGAQPHRILVYDDDGVDPDMTPGAPGSLIAVSREVVVPGDAEPRWYYFDGWEVAPDGPLEPKQYWIGSFADGPEGGLSLYNGCAVAAGDGRLGEDEYTDGAEATFVPRGDRFSFQREIAVFVVHAP